MSRRRSKSRKIIHEQLCEYKEDREFWEDPEGYGDPYSGDEWWWDEYVNGGSYETAMTEFILKRFPGASFIEGLQERIERQNAVMRSIVYEVDY